MLASREITNYIDRGREYPVIVQGEMRRPANAGRHLVTVHPRTDDGRSLCRCRVSSPQGNL
jgi:hypothetical protein